MTRSVPRLLLMPSLLLALSMVAAVSIQAQTLPFSADSFGPFTRTGDPPIVQTHIFHTFSASSPVPLATGVMHQNTNLGTNPFEVTDGVLTFTATNGDLLFGTYYGIVTPNGPLTFDIGPVPVLFTGGTGVFYGASGSGNVTGFGSFDDATFAGGFSELQWRGTLTLVPEPGTAALLLGLALPGMCLLRRRHRVSMD